MQILEIISRDKQPEIYPDEFLHLQNIINLKREMLFQKHKELNKIEHQNHFLEKIKQDYSNYNNYIVKQKQEQIAALSLLNNYVNDLQNSGDLSEHNIKDAKMEQQKIIKELNLIKRSLDKAIKETGM